MVLLFERSPTEPSDGRGSMVTPFQLIRFMAEGCTNDDAAATPEVLRVRLTTWRRRGDWSVPQIQLT
jgi:hypothetical protein